MNGTAGDEGENDAAADDWKFGNGGQRNVVQRTSHRFYGVHVEGERSRWMFPEAVGAYTIHARRVGRPKMWKKDETG